MCISRHRVSLVRRGTVSALSTIRTCISNLIGSEYYDYRGVLLELCGLVDGFLLNQKPGNWCGRGVIMDGKPLNDSAPVEL